MRKEQTQQSLNEKKQQLYDVSRKKTLALDKLMEMRRMVSLGVQQQPVLHRFLLNKRLLLSGQGDGTAGHGGQGGAAEAAERAGKSNCCYQGNTIQ